MPKNSHPHSALLRFASLLRAEKYLPRSSNPNLRFASLYSTISVSAFASIFLVSRRISDSERIMDPPKLD